MRFSYHFSQTVQEHVKGPFLVVEMEKRPTDKQLGSLLRQRTYNREPSSPHLRFEGFVGKLGVRMKGRSRGYQLQLSEAQMANWSSHGQCGFLSWRTEQLADGFCAFF